LLFYWSSPHLCTRTGSKSEGEHGVPLMARVAAGTFGFLTFIQTLEGPER